VNSSAQRRLRVFAGPNGSGKSTLLHRLASSSIPLYQVINADDIQLHLNSTDGLNLGVYGLGPSRDRFRAFVQGTTYALGAKQSADSIHFDGTVVRTTASNASYDAALVAAGIDDDTLDPPGGTIVRTPEGKATGLLRETAQRLVSSAIEEYQALRTPEEVDQVERERVFLASQEALANGVTSFHDAGASFATIDFFKAMEAEGALPIRLYVMVRRESNADMAAQLPDYLMPIEGDDYLTVRSVKRQIDGALGAHGAWLLEPYTDLDSTPGLVLEPVEEIERTAEIALEHGFQVNTHAIGDRANRETLDIYQRVFEAAGVKGQDQRWRIEHAQHIDPADVPRFARMGVIAAMQGIHCTSDGPWIPSRLGEERTRLTSYVWRDLIESGAIIGNGTDVPVEPIDPIASYYASVSRMTIKGEKFYPEHVMTRMEALESYTINNAYAAFEEQAKGSITPGKLADIVVLSQDLLTVPEETIPDTKVEMTIVGGVVKYQRPKG
jgi:predicted amidohydrolase YtcJ